MTKILAIPLRVKDLYGIIGIEIEDIIMKDKKTYKQVDKQYLRQLKVNSLHKWYISFLKVFYKKERIPAD